MRGKSGRTARNKRLDHLKSHAHLTNCIHVKYHMHMHRDQMKHAFRKELSTLKRFHSLRDPSTSSLWTSSGGGSSGLHKRAIKKKPVDDGSAYQNSVEGITLKDENLSASAGRRNMRYASIVQEASEMSENEGLVGLCGLQAAYDFEEDGSSTVQNENRAIEASHLPHTMTKHTAKLRKRRSIKKEDKKSRSRRELHTSSDLASSISNTASQGNTLWQCANDHNARTSGPFEELETLKGPCSSCENHRSLSKKYMPKSFEEIIGQNLVTQSLSSALSKKRIAPLYMFYGPCGTGKSSCAKVFALALNCLSSEEKRPCGSCIECLAPKFGRTSMTKELCPGDRNGSTETRAFLHYVTWSSFFNYTVYIVDECQKLTRHAWNDFLSSVDDSSPKTVFILTTSSLEQVPYAVVSRCQKFLFSKIKESDIISRLLSIAQQEHLEAEVEAVKMIASACDGSLRDAEMALDQLSLLGVEITLPMVQKLMGLIPDNALMALLDFALAADSQNTLRTLKEVMTLGVEPLNLISQLASLITRVILGGYPAPKVMQHRDFFITGESVTKEGMGRLCQALKLLSDAEKHLRSTSDHTTWLAATLLQFASSSPASWTSEVPHGIPKQRSKNCRKRGPKVRHSRRTTPQDKLKNAWVQEGQSGDGSMKASSGEKEEHGKAGNQVSLGFVAQQPEGSVDGYSQDLQFDHMNSIPNRTHLQNSSSCLAFEDENTRLYSTQAGSLCWNGTRRSHVKRRGGQGFLLSLCPCSNSSEHSFDVMRKDRRVDKVSHGDFEHKAMSHEK